MPRLNLKSANLTKLKLGSEKSAAARTLALGTGAYTTICGKKAAYATFCGLGPVFRATSGAWNPFRHAQWKACQVPVAWDRPALSPGPVRLSGTANRVN